MPYRGYRGFRKRNGRPRQVIQSYKKVLNDAPISSAGGTTKQFTLVTGQDGIAQTGAPTDNNVSTGSIIKNITIQAGFANLANTAGFVHVAIMQLNSEQTNINPDTVGGDSRRNQVFYQRLFSVSQGTSVNLNINFKIPKRFQRVREATVWRFLWKNSETMSYAGQAIYKTYR